VEAEKKQCKQ